MDLASYTTLPAEEQLARTDALIRAVAAGEAPATLRWYSYSRPALILGVGQSAALISEPAARAEGFQVVKRSSGGGIVVAQPHMLALDMALPAHHPLAGSDVVEAYRWLGEAFLAGLTHLASLRSPRLRLVSVTEARASRDTARGAPPGALPALEALVCFGTLSPYQVALGAGGEAHKLVGLSQIRKRGVVFFQAGLYTHSWVPEVPLADLLLGPQAGHPGVASPDQLPAVLRTGWGASLADLGLGAGAADAVMRNVTERVQAALRRADATGAARI